MPRIRKVKSPGTERELVVVEIIDPRTVFRQYEGEVIGPQFGRFEGYFGMNGGNTQDGEIHFLFNRQAESLIQVRYLMMDYNCHLRVFRINIFNGRGYETSRIAEMHLYPAI